MDFWLEVGHKNMVTKYPGYDLELINFKRTNFLV